MANIDLVGNGRIPIKLKIALAATVFAASTSLAAADVTTPEGEIVMVEKNQAEASAALLAKLAPLRFAIVIATFASSGGS